MFLPLVSLVAKFLSCVMSYNQGVLGELLKEAFRCRAVNVEVEGLHRNKKCAQREQRVEGAHRGRIEACGWRASVWGDFQACSVRYTAEVF